MGRNYKKKELANFPHKNFLHHKLLLFTLLKWKFRKTKINYVKIASFILYTITGDFAAKI